MSNNRHNTFNSKSLKLWDSSEQASIYVANQIAELISEHRKQGNSVVLGLATGNTPKKVYQELVRLHQNESFSFANVISFNLDEYYPIFPDNDMSYTYFMQKYLFDM